MWYFPSLDVSLNKRTELSRCSLHKLLPNLAHYSLKILLPEALPSSALTFLHGGRIKGFFVYRNGMRQLRSVKGALVSDLHTTDPLISRKSGSLAVMKGGDEEDDGEVVEKKFG